MCIFALLNSLWMLPNAPFNSLRVHGLIIKFLFCSNVIYNALEHENYCPILDKYAIHYTIKLSFW